MDENINLTAGTAPEQAPETQAPAPEQAEKPKKVKTMAVRAKRPIRTNHNKGLFTRGDKLTLPAEEAQALIASGAAEAI